MPKKIETGSDAGGVLIGNASFQFLCRNGYGDGLTEVVIIEESDKRKHPDSAKWVGMISGSGIRVYHYDCSSKSNYTEIPDGRYQLYFLEGTVYIEYVDDDLF